MKYDVVLDEKLVDILYEKSFNDIDSTIGYNQLYRELCKTYRKISKGVYDFHVKKLVDEEILEKKSSGKKNNSVYCYLTTKAKDEKKMQLLVFKSKKEKERYQNITNEDKRARIFLLLFYLLSGSKSYLFKNDNDLEDFLMKNNLTMDNLIINKTTIRRSSKIRITSYDTINHIRVTKIEKILKEGKRISYNFDHYNVSVQGFVIPDFFNSERLWSKGYTLQEINDACNILLKFKYIEIIGTFDNEIRYAITDDFLRDLIVNLFLMINLIRDKMMRIWIYRRKITPAEKKWLLFFGGLEGLEQDLAQIRKEKLEFKMIHNKTKYLAQIKREITYWDSEILKEFSMLKEDYSIEINKFHFPYGNIMGILYPKIFHGYRFI